MKCKLQNNFSKKMTKLKKSNIHLTIIGHNNGTKLLWRWFLHSVKQHF